MIHNSSGDPVLIKKISLKIWSLRDEIESRIQEKIEKGEPTETADLLSIREEYIKKSSTPSNVLNLKSGSDLDNSEDEMAKAMAEMNAEEKKSEATEEEASSEKSDENVIALNSPVENSEIDNNLITIALAPPSISEDKISKGKTVLSEINMDKMFFFCNRAYTEGQSIVIQFCIPKTFIMNADILYCRPFNLKSKIISQNNYSHRVLVKFNFIKEGERALLRQFIQSIEPDLSKSAKKAPAAKKDDDGDSDFNELDDLGL